MHAVLCPERLAAPAGDAWALCGWRKSVGLVAGRVASVTCLWCRSLLQSPGTGVPADVQPQRRHAVCGGTGRSLGVQWFGWRCVILWVHKGFGQLWESHCWGSQPIVPTERLSWHPCRQSEARAAWRVREGVPGSTPTKQYRRSPSFQLKEAAAGFSEGFLCSVGESLLRSAALLV